MTGEYTSLIYSVSVQLAIAAAVFITGAVIFQQLFTNATAAALTIIAVYVASKIFS